MKILCCLNSCRTVSAEALQVLLVVPPLNLEIIRRGTAFTVRIGIISNTDVLVVPGMEECSRKEVKEHL